MLTLDSILAVTRQQAAFGELRAGPVPRDRGARPRTASPSAATDDPDRDSLRSEYAVLLGMNVRNDVQQTRYEELSAIMDAMPHPGMTDDENLRVREAKARLDAKLAAATPEQIDALSRSLNIGDR